MHTNSFFQATKYLQQPTIEGGAAVNSLPTFLCTHHTHTHTHTPHTQLQRLTHTCSHKHTHTKDRHYRHKLVFRLVVQNAKCTYASLSLAKSANINFAQENSNENFKNAFYFVSKTQYFIALQKMEF
jgi:hypothetical protein